MATEDPLRLLGRLRLGREEYCQRLLTMLILGGPYPRWNTPNAPSDRGARFLLELDALSFGTGAWDVRPQFVDEFDLPRRHDDEQGGAPDYAMLWPERLWMIELKTETASHRQGQLSGYLDLAEHHHPARRIDLTYLTPPMPHTPPAAQALQPPHLGSGHSADHRCVGKRRRRRAARRRTTAGRLGQHRNRLEHLAHSPAPGSAGHRARGSRR
ncbi:hypothetical protein OHB01_25840 [Microbispora hainanensis]|uniref:hypothetical protein n=1 Tax=Microbispora TaxID=2005 RepID=UPI002E2DFF69|nr:hypothetical protein [Microbispora hainanensis]